MDVFLKSDDCLKIVNNNFHELSDEALEIIAGGANMKKALTASFAMLIASFTISNTLSNSLFPKNNADNVCISTSSGAGSFSNHSDKDNDTQSGKDITKQLVLNNNENDSDKPGGGGGANSIARLRQNVDRGMGLLEKQSSGVAKTEKRLKLLLIQELALGMMRIKKK